MAALEVVSGQAPDGVGEPGSGGEPPPPSGNPAAKFCRQCLQVLPMALFARVPGDKRAKLCTPCEQAQAEAEATGGPKQCRGCRQVRPLDEFPGDGTRAHGLLCDECLAVLRRRHPETQPSFIPDLPPAAFFVDGLCTDPRTLARTGPVWTSDDPQDRDLARRICRSCDVRLLCLDWSLHLPRWDRGIYAGLAVSGRRKLRSQRQQAPEAAPRETGAA